MTEQAAGTQSIAGQPHWKWNSLAHRLIGEVSQMDGKLTEVVATADARDAEAYDRLLAAYGRRSIDERIRALRSIQRSHVEAVERVCDGTKELTRVRNGLAHAYL